MTTFPMPWCTLAEIDVSLGRNRINAATGINASHDREHHISAALSTKLQNGNNPTSESGVFRYRNQFIPLQESMHPTTEITSNNRNHHISTAQPTKRQHPQFNTPNSESDVLRYRNQSIPLQK